MDPLCQLIHMILGAPQHLVAQNTSSERNVVYVILKNIYLSVILWIILFVSEAECSSIAFQ